MTIATLNPGEGERRKLAAFDVLAARREWLIRLARRGLLAVLIERGEATIDDVRPLAPLPDGINPKIFGVVPGELAMAGIIAADRFVKSTRPEAHARPIQVWRLVDRTAAIRWLALHPPMNSAAPESDIPESLFPAPIAPKFQMR